MTVELKYVMASVSDLPEAVAFWRDTVGLKLKFETPDWAEFDTARPDWPFEKLRRQIRQGHGSLALAFPISRPSAPNSRHAA